VSISLPEGLLRRVDELSKRSDMARSELIAKILEGELGAGEGRRCPTVSWRLSASGRLRLRSPRLPGRAVKGRWVVEGAGMRADRFNARG